MRNCLPKFSKVFRRKSSAKSSSAGRENPSSDPDSDAEPYTISDRSVDNRNERTRPPPDDDSSRLISSAHLDFSMDLNLNSNGGGGIRPKSEGSCPEMKVETIATTTTTETAAPTPGPVAISLPFVGRNSCKTPEEMELEYEANVEAEGRDIMTPLRRNTRPLSVAFSGGGGGGRTSLQPEIVEAIRSLDVPALLLNNLSLEDRERSHLVEEESPSCDPDNAVVLRRKVNCLERKSHSLYERRLPKVPKLHLLVAGKKQSTEEEEFRIFQVAR